MNEEDCAEFLREGKPFTFDLYRIPYNNGQGGKAEPLAGASRNGRSNYFPKYSPDGKWIVFCQARNYMLLQPDSELYIIPAEGGEARRLQVQHGAHELLAQLVAQQPLAGVLLQSQLALHATVPHAH